MPPWHLVLPYHGTVPPWHLMPPMAHGATVAPPATVQGELRVPNTINFRLFPTLDPFAKAVYYELFLLSHGFRRDTCVISLGKLSQRVLMSPTKGPEYNHLPGTKRTRSKAPAGAWRSLERHHLSGLWFRVLTWLPMPPWQAVPPGPHATLAPVLHCTGCHRSTTCRQ